MLGFVGNMITSIFWGALIAVGVVIGVLLLANILQQGKRVSLLGYTLVVAMFFMLAFQVTLYLGARYFRQEMSSWVELVEANVTTIENKGYMDISDAEAILDAIETKIPINLSFVDSPERLVRDTISKGNSIADAFLTEVDCYMCRRLMWALGTVAICFIGILCSMKNPPTSYSSTYNNSEIELY